MLINEILSPSGVSSEKLIDDLSINMGQWWRHMVWDDPERNLDINDFNLGDFMGSKIEKDFTDYWAKPLSKLKAHHLKKIYNKAWARFFDEEWT